MFLHGLHADNLPAPSERTKGLLKVSGSKLVSTLWTPGTKHNWEFYSWCEQELDGPTYVLRVGPSGKTDVRTWSQDLSDALGQVPPHVRADGRLLVKVLNEPNHPDEGGWTGKEYAKFYQKAVALRLGTPILPAGPSQGFPDWKTWHKEFVLAGGLEDAPGVTCHLYAHYARDVDFWLGFGLPVWVTECGWAANRPQLWLADLYHFYAHNGISGATAFITDGRSNGAWDERYILNEPECAAVGLQQFMFIPWGGSMPAVGDGFKKQQVYLGVAVEDEKYHFAGQPQEASLAVFERGSAHWDKKANVSVGVAHDGQSVYVDWGDRIQEVKRGW